MSTRGLILVRDWNARVPCNNFGRKPESSLVVTRIVPEAPTKSLAPASCTCPTIVGEIET